MPPTFPREGGEGGKPLGQHSRKGMSNLATLVYALLAMWQHMTGLWIRHGRFRKQ